MGNFADELRDKLKVKALSDPRSTEELISAALSDQEDDAESDPLLVLWYRGNRETFEAAKDLCQNPDPDKRWLGPRILGQLGVPDSPFLEESVEILLDLLATEQHPEVLQFVASACGDLGAEKTVPALVALKHHADAGVRFGVVIGLLCQEDEQAIQALIELSSDDDREVRNWATFGLADMIEIDTPAIREALYERLRSEPAGEADEVYGEALVGLAIRKDDRVVEPLLKELSSEYVGRLAVEAASYISHPKLYNILMRLREWWDVDKNLLEDAIENSTGKAGETSNENYFA